MLHLSGMDAPTSLEIAISASRSSNPQQLFVVCQLNFGVILKIRQPQLHIRLSVGQNRHWHFILTIDAIALAI